ncbi:MAG TPA: tRNA modification GTPase [Stellaceae bacterium]|nr:tRNA modification GTPase [Stellaceae bacterium]
MAEGDTIYAFSTAPGRAAIAVLRLSGPAAPAALRALGGKLPKPRRAAVLSFADPASGEAIDRGIALYFPAPSSHTGEDMAELHLHGGRAVAAAMLDALGKMPGLRLAEPGEFTRRAFLNGKLDLTEAEGVADLIAAETAAQRRQALRQASGAAAKIYEDWRHRLLTAQARLEAEIDFPEEGLPDDLRRQATDDIARLAAEIAASLEDNRGGEMLRSGFEVALDLGGYPVVLADTAGLRESSNEIEEEGVRRARERAAHADLKLVVLDATKPGEAKALAPLIGPGTLVVANKMDLNPKDNAAWADELGAGKAVRISVKTGAGLRELEAGLREMVAARFSSAAAPLITRARHRQALEECAAALARFPGTVAPELAAEELRRAVRALGRITGRVEVEDLLDVLFREFCIGK